MTVGKFRLLVALTLAQLAASAGGLGLDRTKFANAVKSVPKSGRGKDWTHDPERMDRAIAKRVRRRKRAQGSTS